jgi:phenylacetate-CoA ligase
MNWRKPIIESILRMTGSTMKYLAEYEKTQWYSYEQLKEYQHRKLEQLIFHSSNHVPYYKKVMNERGLIKDGRVFLDNFTNLPFLTKGILRNNFEELKSDDLNNRSWFKNSTGGSTGEPVAIIQDEEYANSGRALTILGSRMAGKDIGEPEISLWGSEQDLFQGTVGLNAKIRNYIWNRKILNSFKMSQNDMKEYIARINTIEPKLIVSYAQSAYELARFSLEQSLTIMNVDAVITSAGTLFPFMRDTISKAFYCSVFNRYGSRDVGHIATECHAHLGLHVNIETHFVEIIDEKGELCLPGKEGEIVITLLSNYAMPLIRYCIGDMGIWADHECICGRGLPLLETVTGRTMDYFVTKEGRIVPSEFFIHLLGVVFNSGWVKKTQIIQEDYDYIKVKFVVYTKPSNETIKEITDKIQLVMGKSCKVEFESVDDIPPSSSGKYRYTISKVHNSMEKQR